MRHLRFRNISEKTLSILASVGILCGAGILGIFTGIDRAVYDTLSQISLTEGIRDTQIVLVTVEDSTVERYGNEAFWTRTRYKVLLDQLESAWAKAVYFDYYFSDKSRPENVDWDLLKESGDLSDETLDDAFTRYSQAVKTKDFVSEIDYDFARAMKAYGNVYLPKLLRSTQKGYSGTVIEPLEIFSKNAHVGFSNSLPDSDGVERRAFKTIEGESSVALLLSEEITGKRSSILPNEWYRPRFSGTPNSGVFSIIPFEYAYNGKMTDRIGNPISLSGSIVIVGDYSQSSWDLHAVPTGKNKLMSGMEVIAHQVKSLAEKTFLRELPLWMEMSGFGVVVILSALIFLWVESPIIAGIIGIVAIGIMVGICSFAFLYLWYWIPPTSSIFAIIAPLSGFSYATYRKNTQEGAKVRKIFSRYVSPSIVETLVKQGETVDLEGEKREVSILFADIQGFTSLSEHLSPKETVTRLNGIFREINRTIFERNGTINKYIGDAIMAFWWAPMQQEDHAVRAVRAALEIAERTKKLDPELRVRIGIATGEVMVGNVGDERFSDYTVMGDRVNFASRLEGITREYGTDILVSKETFEKAKKTFLFREIDSVRVKGKTIAEKIYEPLRPKIANDQWEMEKTESHEKALALYRKGNLSAAEKAFSFNSLNGDAVAEAFLKRLAAWEWIPPKHFDGTHSFETK